MNKNWHIKTLGEVCETTSGGTPSRGNKSYYNGSIPWVKSGELNKGVILDTEEKITEEAIKNSSAKIFPKGTLLIALYGATIGKLAFLGVDAATNQAICGIYQNDTIDSKYIYNFLFHKKQDLVKQGIGGAQPNISQTILKKLEIPLPPLETQQAIVSKIEELFSELDKGIQDLKTAQLQLKTYRQSVLKYAFEGKLTNKKVKDGVLPKGWEITTLGVACERIFDGTHFSPKNYPSGKYKYITAKNIKEKGIDLTKISYISEEDHREIYSRSNVKRGDVLYIKDGATTGIACINNFDEEFSLLSSVGVFRVNHEKIESKYLCYFLNSQVTRNKMLSNIAGVAITRLTLIKLKNSEFILAPFKEQHKIVQEIESRLSVADKTEESIAQSLRQAEALRQSILKKAFSGELV